MQNIIDKVNNPLIIKISKVILIAISTPFVAYLFNLILLMLFNLGHGTGSFIRNLYKFIC